LLNFVLPQITCVVGTQNYGRFVISPLENGYGTTLGNALRRVLLSSLDGAAVTSLRVADVPHEFSTIPGVREDMMLFILNVKQIRFILSGPGGYGTSGGTGTSPEMARLHSDAGGGHQNVGAGPSSATASAWAGFDGHGLRSGDPSDAIRPPGLADRSIESADRSIGSAVGPMRLRLSVRGQGVVTAGDIVCPPEVEIVNPELYLFTVDDPDTELDIEMTVERGRGYSPSEERGKLPIGELPVDAVFSPIRKANYDVTPARVGQMTNYDSLNLEIWTDGTMRPQQALAISAELLIRHLALFAGVEALQAAAEVAPGAGAWGVEGGAIRPQPDGHTVPVGMGPGAGAGQGQAGAAGAVSSRAYDVPIEELDLSVRVYNCLKRTGITKVGEVLAKMEKGPDEMLAIRNFGVKSLDQLREKLVEKGYLPDEDAGDD
jgi:DNA-directed RNA polymerase alpha subunit